MKKFEKLIFNLTLVLIGLIFNAFSFIYAVAHPVTSNGNSGLWAEAYERNIRKPWLSTKSETNINKAPGTMHQEL